MQKKHVCAAVEPRSSCNRTKPPLPVQFGMVMDSRELDSSFLQQESYLRASQLRFIADQKVGCLEHNVPLRDRNELSQFA